MVRRARPLFVALLAIVSLSAACAPAPGGVTPMAQRDDVTNLRAVPLHALEAVGEQAVEARFVSGVQPCTAVGRVDVEETESAVTVTVWIGTPASEKNTVCIAITQLHSVRASLGSPLGDRELIDGFPFA